MPRRRRNHLDDDEPPVVDDVGSHSSPVPSGVPSGSQDSSPDHATRLLTGRALEPDENEEVADTAGDPQVDEETLTYWQTASHDVRFYAPSTKCVTMSCLCPPQHALATMDSVSKCWECLPSDSTELLLGPTDGEPLCFVDENAGYISEHIMNALYFFHTLLTVMLVDMSAHVCDTNGLKVSGNARNPKVLCNIIRKLGRQNFTAQQRAGTRDDDEYDPSEMLREDITSNANGGEISIPPLRILLGQSGCVFTRSSGEIVRKIFDVLIVIPAINFDIFGAINQSLLAKPLIGFGGSTSMSQQCEHLSRLWNMIQCREASVNLSLQGFGDPKQYNNDPYGILGVMTTCHMFQVAIKIYHCIKKDYGTVKDLQIHGLPENFNMRRDNQDFEKYREYLTAYLSIAKKRYDQLVGKIMKFKEKRASKKKSKKKSPDDLDDDSDDSEAEEEDVPFECSGGWPLKKNTTTGQVLMFGVPPFTYHAYKFPEDKHPHESRESFEANIGGRGGLPTYTTALTQMFFTNPGLDTSMDESALQILKRVCPSTEKKTPTMVYETFYGARADPVSSLKISGRLIHWWYALKAEIKERSTEDDCGYEKRVNLLKSVGKQVKTGLGNLVAAVEGGEFKSKGIAQAWEVIKKFDYSFALIGKEDGNLQCLSEYMNETHGKMGAERKFDLYACAADAILNGFHELNITFRLNSLNLLYLIQLMISQAMYRFGQNMTWVRFGECLMAVSGYGHFYVTTKEGPVMDTSKANTTGINFVLSLFAQLTGYLLRHINIFNPSHNHLAIKEIPGWTPKALELATCVTVVDGKIINIPSEMHEVRAFPEVRGNPQNMEAMVLDGLARGKEAATQSSLNTVDTECNNNRKAMDRTKVCDLGAVVISSNKRLNSSTIEPYISALAVCVGLLPGAVQCHEPRKKQRGLGEGSVNQFSGLGGTPARENLMSILLVYSHIIAQFAGLANQIGVIQAEINPIAETYLGLLMHYCRDICGGLLNPVFAKNSSRKEQAYTSRTAVHAMWVRSVQYMLISQSPQETIQKLCIANYADALPIHDVPSVPFSYLTAGLDVGVLLMVVLAAEELDAPVLRPDQLIQFLEDLDKPVPTEGLALSTYSQIKKFFVDCVNGHRFCPENNGIYDLTNNISMHITSNGTSNQKVIDPKNSLLRVNPFKPNHTSSEVISAVADQIKMTHGVLLTNGCHFGPESSLYANSISAGCNSTADFREFFGENLYNGKKILEKVGALQYIPGVSSGEAKAPCVFRTTECRSTPTDLESVCVGIDAMSMLAILSLIGDRQLHPSVSGKASQSILSLVLRYFPASFTPGNLVRCLNFDPDSTKNRPIIVSNRERPPYLPRVQNDRRFMDIGVHTHGHAIRLNAVSNDIGDEIQKGYLPEHVVHCAAFLPFAALLHCSVFDVPPAYVEVSYAIQANVKYPIWNPSTSTRTFGSLVIDTKADNVQIVITSDGGAAQPTTLPLDRWQSDLKALNFLIPPVISAYGIVVYVKTAGDVMKLGHVIPQADNLTFIDFATGRYRVLFSDDTRMALCMRETMNSVLCPGVKLLLDAAKLPNVADRVEGKKLCVRLNVPSGKAPERRKIYVSCYRKVRGSRRLAADKVMETFPVEIQDLELLDRFAGDKSTILYELA